VVPVKKHSEGELPDFFTPSLQLLMPPHPYPHSGKKGALPLKVIEPLLRNRSPPPLAKIRA